MDTQNNNPDDKSDDKSDDRSEFNPQSAPEVPSSMPEVSSPSPLASISPPTPRVNLAFLKKLRFDWRIIVIVLLAIGLAFMLYRQSTAKPDADTPTVRVEGTATVKDTPDEYRFSPNYEFTNADKSKAIAEASAKQSDIVAKLKTLGVADKDIKTDINGSEDYDYSPTSYGKAGTYTYRLTVEASAPSRDSAQKVQDYLVTTSPLNSVTPYVTFSEAKRKEVESKARDEATKDARAKADQSAKNIGFKVGKVKRVDDSSGFGGSPIPYGVNMGAELSIGTDSSTKAIAPSVQPGQNDLSYSVSVEYYIK